METLTVDQTVDCRGLSCPMPMLKVKKALAGMRAGEILLMMGTDPGTKNDMGSGLKKHGGELLDTRDEEGYTGYYVKKL